MLSYFYFVSIRVLNDHFAMCEAQFQTLAKGEHYNILCGTLFENPASIMTDITGYISVQMLAVRRKSRSRRCSFPWPRRLGPNLFMTPQEMAMFRTSTLISFLRQFPGTVRDCYGTNFMKTISLYWLYHCPISMYRNCLSKSIRYVIS